MVRVKNIIFISYRKDDTGGWASTLAMLLREIMGREAVFFDDSQGIQYGTCWQDEIEIALDQCRVFLPVIAPSWIQEPNLSRLHNPEDWVRKELVQALSRQSVLTIPVFVNEAPFLNSKYFSDDLVLKEAIEKLMIHQGLHLDRSTEFWPPRIDSLITRIEKHTGIVTQRASHESQSTGGIGNISISGASGVKINNKTTVNSEEL